MNLEDQVCSLELSKRLKELGVKQESIYTYEFSHYYGEDRWSLERTVDLNNYWDHTKSCSAFTVSELLEDNTCDYYVCQNMLWFGEKREIGIEINDGNLANAFAKRKISLIEKGIITP